MKGRAGDMGGSHRRPSQRPSGAQPAETRARTAKNGPVRTVWQMDIQLPFNIRVAGGRVCLSSGEVITPIDVGEAAYLCDTLRLHSGKAREVLGSNITILPLLNVTLPGIATLVNPLQAGILADRLADALAEIAESDKRTAAR